MDDVFIREPVGAEAPDVRPRSRAKSARRSAGRANELAPEPFTTFEAPPTLFFDAVPANAAPRNFAEDPIGIAGALAIALLDERVSAGDAELGAVRRVIERCLSLISTMPPLAHVASLPLRPDDRFYQLFDQFLSLLRQQEGQMQELQTMINELI